LRRNISPPELYMRLTRLPDFNPKELAWDFELEKLALEDLSEQATEEWVRYHLPRERQWFRLAEFLLKDQRPDLMAVMFDGTDKIQHQAWQFLDPALTPTRQSAWETRMREVCLSYFRHLDRYIEALVELVGSDAQVFLASDHGFTATTHVLRLNTFLHDKGYLKWKAYSEDSVEQRRNNSNFANVDWDTTLAYCPTPSSNGITIRVARSAGAPGVQPKDYAAFRERIINELRGLKDPETGTPMVRTIMKREDAFAGPYVDHAPDLTLVLNDYGFVSIRNLQPVVIKRKAPAGTHHADGIFLGAGRGITEGLAGERKRIVDVAPTLLYSLGLPVPADFEGSVPTEFFSSDFRAANPVVIGAETLPVQEGEVEDEGMAEDDKDRMIRQLQMLGYME
jgi:predicted AlkP superfamily phosphohydrolase/phosphomutase